uniref:Uncharacterized protein n=1 Tax=Panagrellus redivivus TaxID=6233 RepID=A0A7E4VXZ9_PANRE
MTSDPELLQSSGQRFGLNSRRYLSHHVTLFHFGIGQIHMQALIAAAKRRRNLTINVPSDNMKIHSIASRLSGSKKEVRCQTGATKQPKASRQSNCKKL